MSVYKQLTSMKPDALKHAMYYGLILGLIFCLNFFLSTLKGATYSLLQMLITCAIPFVCYWLTVDCRKRVCNDVMTYGGALWYGIQLFFYASLISAAFKYIYFQFINTDFLPNLIDESLNLMDELNLSSGADSKQIRTLLSPLNFSIQYIWINVFLGILVSCVTAAFAKKDATPFDETTQEPTETPNNQE